MVLFVVPCVLFDLASFSFQVPICGSAAKHTAPPKKQNARVNPSAFVFMCSIGTGFRLAVNIFPNLTASDSAVWSTGNDFFDFGRGNSRSRSARSSLVSL